MSPIHIGIIGIVVLIAILFSKLPVAFCMALVGLLGFGYLVSPEAARSITMQDFYSAFTSYNMTVVLMGGLFAGIFTPTEAGAVGALGGVIISLVSRRLKWKGFVEALYSSTQTTCMVLTIVAGATVFGHFLAMSTIPKNLSTWVVGLPLPSWGIMLVIMSFFLIGGFFMDALGMILLTIPIFYPVTVALGYDPIWFGVVIVLVTELGVITPPVGINVYVVSGISKVPLNVIFKGAFPYAMALCAYLVIMTIFPEIALFLPNFMTY